MSPPSFPPLECLVTDVCVALHLTFNMNSVGQTQVLRLVPENIYPLSNLPMLEPYIGSADDARGLVTNTLQTMPFSSASSSVFTGQCDA